MKVHWHRTSISILMITLFLTDILYGQPSLLTRKQASIVAESTDEVKQLYDLRGGRFVNCIEKKVERPCESDWVTCVDDAWVVRFVVGNQCLIEHDGRLSVTILVDAKTKEIISRFPEVEYFLEDKYCHENYDCLYIDAENSLGSMCLNFIHGYLENKAAKKSEQCWCQNNKCSLTR